MPELQQIIELLKEMLARLESIEAATLAGFETPATKANRERNDREREAREALNNPPHLVR